MYLILAEVTYLKYYACINEHVVNIYMIRWYICHKNEQLKGNSYTPSYFIFCVRLLFSTCPQLTLVIKTLFYGKMLITDLIPDKCYIIFSVTTLILYFSIFSFASVKHSSAEICLLLIMAGT